MSWDVLAVVVSCCVSRSFLLSELSSPVVSLPKLQRLSSDLTAFSQQLASDVDSARPVCVALPGYSYSVTAPW